MAAVAAGVALIKSFEGFRAQMYNDPSGTARSGTAHSCTRASATDAPAEQSVRERRHRDAGDAAARARSARVPAGRQRGGQGAAQPEPERRARQLRLQRRRPGTSTSSTLLREAQRKDYAAVPVELRKWTKARENGKLVELPGSSPGEARRPSCSSARRTASRARRRARVGGAAVASVHRPARRELAAGRRRRQADPRIHPQRGRDAGGTHLFGRTSSRFYKRLTNHYLKAYLAAPSAATGQAAIDAVGKTFAGPATAGDRWEDGAIRLWNKQPIPAAFRRMRPDLLPNSRRRPTSSAGPTARSCPT